MLIAIRYFFCPPPLPLTPSLLHLVFAEYENLELKDLVTLATIGIGGFGRVVLVKHYTTKDTSLNIFALKQMKKVHILETKQEEHVFNERKIMLACKSK
jgi:cGMP-dependent protein kinase